MIGVITWVVDCGDGECIEREQPSTAFKPMAAFMKIGGIRGEFAPAPEADGFMKLGDIKGEFVSTPQDDITEVQKAGIAKENLLPGTANRALGGTAGPGGTTFPTEKVAGFPYDSFGVDSSTVEVVTFTGFPYETQGLNAGGVNYAEAVGLDSSIFDVGNNISGSAGLGGDDI